MGQWKLLASSPISLIFVQWMLEQKEGETGDEARKL